LWRFKVLLNLPILANKYDIFVKGIIQVGAHTGEEVEEFRRLFTPKVKMHLFEPQKKYFKIIEKKYITSKFINYYNFGCGNENKIIQLNLSDNSGASSSILKPKLHLEFHPDVNFIGTETIEIKKLDNFNISDSNFLSIDVQGYELEVLKGSAKTLNSIDYIYVEVNSGEVYEGCAKIEEIDDFLDNHNFLRVATKFAYDFLPWGDAFYVRRENLNNTQILRAKIYKYIISKKYLYKYFIYLRKFYWKLISN